MSSSSNSSNNKNNNNNNDDSCDDDSSCSLAEKEERLREIEEKLQREAEMLEEQRRALEEEAARLREAIAELIAAKEEAIREIEYRIAALTDLDTQYARALKAKRDELQQFVSMLENVKNSIDDSFPITCVSTTAANLALAAGLANMIGQAGAQIAPSIAHAAERLTEVAQGVVNTAMEVEPKLAGMPIFNAMGLDPINMATGNFYYTKEDIAVPGRYPLIFKRSYNAIGSFDCVLGQGWTHNYNIRLFQHEGLVHITFEDGHVETYTYIDENFYVAPLEHKNALVVPEDGYGGFDLLLQNNIRYRFDEIGALRQIDDPNGNKTLLDYDGGGVLLTKVSTQSGSLSFEYNDEGRLAKVSDHTGRNVSFEYTENQLTKVTHLNGGTFQYEYDSGRIAKITNPLGVEAVQNKYDSQGRTIMQDLADGGKSRLTYDEERMMTIVTEQNGSRTEYHRDEKYRTTKIVYDEGVYETYEWDEASNCIKYIDKDKNVWRYEYDIYGNTTAVVDPMGDKTTVEYNDHNKPTVITGANGGIIKNTYDPYGNVIGITDPIGRQMDFACDEQGKVTMLTLPDSSKNTVEHDERGNIISITDSMGATTRYEYDFLNRVIKSINGEGAATTFEYNTMGDISKATDAFGNTRTYEYNLTGKVTKITDFNGTTMEYKYNKIGKIKEIIDQAGNSTKLTYDIMWNVTSVIDPNGNTISYGYDRFNRVSRITDEEGNSTVYRYNHNGNLLAIVPEATGIMTRLRYDKLGRQKEIIEANGASTKLVRDEMGNIIQVTDAMGNVTRYEYDLAGQLVKIIDPLGNETRFTYTALGQVETITNAKGDKQTYSYYPGGKLKSVTLPCGETETYIYNKNGNIVKVIDGLGNVTKLVYDSLDRVIESINPLGHSKKYRYDAVGNITQVTDENGNVTQYKYSALGDIVEVIDAAGHSTKYGYDNMKRLVELRQFNNLGEPQITTYERNKKGEVIAVTSSLGDIVKYGYDKAGNVVSKLDEDNNETLYEYNFVNKLTKVGYADGKTVEFEYNALKQLTEMRDWLGTTKFELDAFGRATKVTNHDNQEVGYVYNNLGQREKLIYPDGKEVGYEYNASGKLNKVLDGTDITSYNFDQMGRIQERMLPDGTTTKYEFNALNALVSLTHSKGTDILDQFKYGYDPVGNITQIGKYRVGIESDNGLFKYGYDQLNRLVEAANAQGSKQYIYDNLGNRLASIQNGTETKHHFNDRNQLIKTLEGDIATDYSYDGRGNLTNVTENGVSKASYTFDATNMMVAASTPKGDASYSYNGFRNRVQKLENFQNEVTANLPDPCKEVNYILDITLPYNNLLVAQGTENQNFTWGYSLLSGKGKSTFYYLQDHLSSPIRLLGNEQDAALAYDEFGVPMMEVNPRDFNNPFGFTGYQVDNIAEVQYAQARYYDPVIGRFVAEDPIKDRLNWYEYCIGNPVSWVDPRGLHIEVIQDGNNITINAYFNFVHTQRTEDLDPNERSPHSDEITPCADFLEGIIRHWDGIFDEFEVTVNANECVDGIRVNLNAGQGRPNLTVRGGLFNLFRNPERVWSNDNRGTINMYLGDSRRGHWYTRDEFMWVAAHEFGHLMGLADASIDEFTASSIASIMNGFMDDVTVDDIRKLLEAWNTSNWQVWRGVEGYNIPRLPLAPAPAPSQLREC